MTTKTPRLWFWTAKYDYVISKKQHKLRTAINGEWQSLVSDSYHAVTLFIAYI